MAKYDVFLSQSEEDEELEWVEIIAQRLRQEAQLKPFFESWHLVPGRPKQEALEEALHDSETMAVFVGRSGISYWHNEKMRIAVDKAVRTYDEYRVIPVLLPGADPHSIPDLLARRIWVDFRSALDDAEAFERLVAGIKGEAIQSGDYDLPDEPAPYRGLRRFEAKHARFFFGRKADTKRLVEKLGQHEFVAVVGASGSGKSSLVRAGLLPALADDALQDSSEWRHLIFTPGSQPLRALAAQLATLVPEADRLRTADDLTARLAERPDGLRTAVTTLLADRPQPLLLVVDQFEELFTLCQEGPQRCRIQAEQFVANLDDAVRHGDGNIRVLITLRADFLDRCLDFPALRDLLEGRQALLGALQEADLREAVVRPARVVGAFFEKGLVSAILHDVEEEPGALPLLQHALYELWRERRGPWLTFDAYEASGGVSGALQRRAQTTYEALASDEQRAIARRIFLRLTTLGEGVSDTRRRVARKELYLEEADPAQVDAVLQALSGPEARLIVADDESVEVTHETLIKKWDTLRGWLEADREALRTQRRLTEAANEWAEPENDRDEGYLYRGARLAEAEEWAEAHPGDMNPLEREFLEASIELRDREAREKERQRQRELEAAQKLAEEAEARRLAEEQRAQEAEAREREQAQSAVQLRRRALWLGAALILAMMAVVATVWFWRQSARQTERAEHQSRIALIALARELAARSSDMLETDPKLGLLLAIEAVNVTYKHPEDGTPTSEAEVALYRALIPTPRGVLRGHKGQVNSASFNHDGTRIVTASSWDGTARLWDAEGNFIKALEGHTDLVWSASFNYDGTRIVTASQDGTARLWDAEGNFIKALEGHTDSVWSASFNRDGTRIVTASRDGTARLWDAEGNFIKALEGHTDSVWSASFNRDGTRIVTASSDGTARLWDAEGNFITALEGHTGEVTSASFNRDGTRIVTASNDDTARLWDAEGNPLAELKGHEDLVWSASFNRDGTRIVTASNDDTARLWDAWSDIDEMLDEAAQRAGRKLTEVECQRYLHIESEEEWRQLFPGREYRQTCEELPSEE